MNMMETVEQNWLDQALKESHPDVQAWVKSVESQLNDEKSRFNVVESQLKTMTAKNKELFSLLEQEECKSAKMSSDLNLCRDELQSLGKKYRELLETSRSANLTAANNIRENSLKADEIRLLNTELDQLKQINSELKIKSTVELEAVEEQLRLRKEKQYQLLSKLQTQEEVAQKSDDRMKEMELEIRDLHQKSSELQAALQLEANARLSQDNINRSMSTDYQGTLAENKDLRCKIQEAEQARLKLEAEARCNADQLREMAEKVFQLLERLKLAELGKKKSMEALGKKDHELFIIKKQHAKIVDENDNQKKMNEQTEAKRQLVEDQLHGMQKLNTQLSQKLKDETKSRLREEDACNEAKEKIRMLDGRLAFLLNKLQTDEEARSAQHENMKKMESQLQITTQRCEMLQTKLIETEDTMRESNEKSQCTQQLLNELKIKNQSLEKTLTQLENDAIREEKKTIQSKERFDKIYSSGIMRFFVDGKLSLGHVVVTGRSPKDKAWIEESGCNSFLKKVLKSQNVQELLIKRVAELYGFLLCGEEHLEAIKTDLKMQEAELERVNQKLVCAQEDALKEEESKRQILLRYIRAVKASASLGEIGCEEDRKEVGGLGAGKINLPESNLGDEEAHIIAAMLHNNETIEELQFRRNNIGDDGAMAIAAVLAQRSAIKLIDLRENQVSLVGVKAIAEALERSDRVHKVVVHPGGKIEAIGASDNIIAVKTVCIVDLRENQPALDNKAIAKSHHPTNNKPLKMITFHSRKQHGSKKSHRGNEECDSI